MSDERTLTLNVCRYILRRDKTLVVDLPEKTQTAIPIGLPHMSYSRYCMYEELCIKQMEMLANLDDDTSPQAVRKKMELGICILSTMTCQRMLLIHTMLPGQGREISAHFSPSRCESVLRQISSKRLCVGCLAKRSGLDVPGLEDQNEQGSLADEDEDEDEGLSSRPGKDAPGGKDRKGVGGRQRKRKSKRAQADRYLTGNESTDEEEDDTSSDATVKKGTIKLDASICASADTCPHFACLECEKTIRAAHTQSGSMSCPRCLDLQLRMEHSWDERAPGQRVYCQDIFPFGEDAKMPSGNKAAGGFVCSAKIQQALDWTSNLPPGEKGIIFSFFKGGFDLIEGALEELQIGCARFDGDVPSEARQQELMRFKKDAACRVMLMSVGTGGTGLNITEANHGSVYVRVDTHTHTHTFTCLRMCPANL